MSFYDLQNPKEAFHTRGCFHVNTHTCVHLYPVVVVFFLYDVRNIKSPDFRSSSGRLFTKKKKKTHPSFIATSRITSKSGSINQATTLHRKDEKNAVLLTETVPIKSNHVLNSGAVGVSSLPEE